MADNWTLRELGDVGVAVLDCEHKTPPDAGEGFAYIAIPDLVDGRVDLSSVRRITTGQLAEWTRRTKPRGGDVVVTRRGRVGYSAPIPLGLECAIGQNLVLLRSDDSQVEQRYLRWATTGPQWYQEVDRLRNVGAVFDSLNVRDISRLRIPVPPRSQQRSICEVLDSLDDKIQANRRRIGITQELMGALWDHRFATEGNGWEQTTIADVAKVVGGSTPRTTNPEFWDGELSWATPKDLSRLPSLPLRATARSITKAGLQQISSGLLPTGTVLLSSRAPIGLLAIAECPVAVNQGFIALMPARLPGLYLWQWLMHNMKAIQDRANGTTFQEISKANFRPMRIVVPPQEDIEQWLQTAEPLYRQIVALEGESDKLTSLRDTLLPKLISGELRVRDAEAELESVG